MPKNRWIRQESKPPNVRICQNFEARHQRTSKNNVLASPLSCTHYTDNSDNAIYEGLRCCDNGRILTSINTSLRLCATVWAYNTTSRHAPLVNPGRESVSPGLVINYRSHWSHVMESYSCLQHRTAASVEWFPLPRCGVWQNLQLLLMCLSIFIVMSCQVVYRHHLGIAWRQLAKFTS